MGGTFCQDRRTGMFGCIFLLPLLASIESKLTIFPILEVKSEIVTHAAIDKVWKQIIAFPEIRSKPDGLFAWGIAQEKP